MNKYQQGRSIIGMLFLSIIACFLSYAGVIKLRVFLTDWEVNRLCAKEGGIHIYEKVYLPSGYSDYLPGAYLDDRSRQINRMAIKKIFGRSFDCSVSSEYPIYAIDGSQTPVGKSSNPILYKYRDYVMRCGDGKILGEFIKCGRWGGHVIPLPVPDDAYVCKVPGDRLTMLETVFSKEQP